MITKTAIAAAIIFGTASVALASEADPNLLNRYPGYNMTQSAVAPAFETRHVALPQAAIVSSSNWIDRASQNFGGGY